MEEERIRILTMVKEGKLSTEEALQLLEALEQGESEGHEEKAGSKVKWLRVRVTDTKTNRQKVNVNVPMGLVDWALKIGTRYSFMGGVDLKDSGVDMEQLRLAINQGLRGKIVDVTDDESGEHVEVIVE